MALKLRDLVARLRIVLDKKGQVEAEQSVVGAFEKMKGAAYKVGFAIGAAFSAKKLFDFGKASVKAAAESEAIWNRLAGAVERTGVRFDDVRRKLGAAAQALKETSVVGDEEFAETLDRLIGLTGDFDQSLRAVPLVADVAARFFRGEMAPAADLVGRALVGQTRALRQLGIVTKDATEGLRILAERSQGAAQRELQTLSGAGKALARNFGDLKEEIGGIISRVLHLPSVLGGLARAIDWLTERLKRLGEARQETEERLRAEAEGVGGPLTARASPEEQQAAAEKEIALLKRAADLQVLGAQHLLRAVRIRRELKEELAQENLSLERQVQLTERINTLNEIIGSRFRLGAFGGQALPGGVTANVRRESITRAPLLVGADPRLLGQAPRLDDNVVDAFRSGFRDIEDAALSAADGISQGFRDMSLMLIDDFGNIGGAVEALGRGIGGALLGGLSQFFSSKVRENIAWSAEELAKGFAALGNPLLAATAPLHFTASAKFAGSAALWAIAAGGASAGQSSISGRGGRSSFSGGAREASTRTFDTAKGPQTIIYIDGFNPKNPVHVRILGQGIKEAQRTDSQVEIRPRSAAT